MARVLPEPPEGGQQTWKIRCAQASGSLYTKAVEGCFRLIEAEADDFTVFSDGDGGSHYYMTCPSCGLTLYPAWQMFGVSASQIKVAKTQRQRASK